MDLAGVFWLGPDKYVYTYMYTYTQPLFWGSKNLFLFIVVWKQVKWIHKYAI